MSRRTASSTSAKFDLADQIIGNRYGYQRPAGGFFLWLDVRRIRRQRSRDQAAVAEAGVRVMPGRYLAREQADGSNPGEGYIRVAMVQDKATTAEALHRLVAVLRLRNVHVAHPIAASTSSTLSRIISATSCGGACASWAASP